jgi:hypothetical protein
VAGLGVATALYALIFGELPTYGNPNPMGADEAILMLLNSLGIGTLRAGIAKTNGQPQG